jgi:uncharacterized membrane protein YjgN (DUF898 family)
MPGDASATVAIAADGFATGERTVRPAFNASAGEYFRIWIVNLLFTVITLGIYSAWAKVRKKRYFYGCTRFEGDSFDYLGSPKVILKGRIVAVVAFAAYALCGELYPMSKFGFLAAFVLCLPWLVVRTLAFNARNSAFRGLRFNFTGTAGEAARYFIGMPILVLLTLGFGYPWFVARNKAFLVSRHAFGISELGCELRVWDFYRTYLLAVLLTIVLMAPVGGLVAYVTFKFSLSPSLNWLRFVMPVVPAYLAYSIVYAFVQARTTNLVWNGAYGRGVRFSSTLTAKGLAWLYVGNIVAAAVSAGLLIPWAVVRTLRYRLDNFSVTVEGDTVYEADPALEGVGAAGQEFGDIFNMDFGI